MMKPIRFLSVLMIVLVLCCGCQRTVNPEQKGNITLYQMADDGSKLQSSEYEIQADQEDNVAVIQELLDCFKKCVAIDNFQLKEKQLTITFLSSYYNQDKIDESCRYRKDALSVEQCGIRRILCGRQSSCD